jgi:hypothetical protein
MLMYKACISWYGPEFVEVALGQATLKLARKMIAVVVLWSRPG